MSRRSVMACELGPGCRARMPHPGKDSSRQTCSHRFRAEQLAEYCASNKISNWIPNGDLDSAVDRLLDPRSPFALPRAEHWVSQLRMTA